MFLKALEIQGFKSFPDKTVIQFGSDITAIVGPNGSGKSNISDAIRWVMGEQSTKALRGAKMEDVIFGGTQKRAPVGFAEASLIFDNSDTSFKLQTPEIMVTRRFYRSGESEYYINKQSARLRDINELFMDTGLGREGYSNISQGRIDEILSVKSADRREIFEEAAGISKYRHRKEQTERRLENTEDNLLRIGDKISELELQVVPLREQAEKAKRYLEYRGTLRGLEVTVWLDSLQKLSQTARRAEENYRSAAFILQQEHENLQQLYDLAEQMRQQLHEKDVEAEEKRAEISEMEAAEQQYSEQLAVLKNNIENNEQNISRLQREMLDQEDRSGSISTQIVQGQQRVEQLRLAREQTQKDLTQAQAEAEQLASTASGRNRQFLELRAEQTRLSAEIAARTADLSALEGNIAAAASRRQSVWEDAQAAAERKQNTEQQLLKTQTRLQTAREKQKQLENQIAGYALRVSSRQQQQQTLKQAVDKTSLELETVRSRCRILQEMEREYEGFSKAVRFIMQQAESGALRNIHGPVSSLIRTDDSYTLAIEIALGSAMQQIVVSSEQDGKYAIRLLSRHDSGRATFLPLSTIRGKLLNEKDLRAQNGFVAIASELVRYAPEYEQIVQYLLGRTVIAQDMDAAIAIARAYSHRFRIVTLDGQVLNVGGSMTGGSVSKNTGILSRANQIQKLTEQQERLGRQLEQNRQKLTEASRMLEKSNYEMTAAQDSLQQLHDEILRLEGEEKQYAILADAIRQAMESANRELAGIDGRTQQDTASGQRLQDQLERLQNSQGQVEKALETVAADSKLAEEQSDQLAEKLTGLRMRQAALQAEQQSAQTSLAGLQELLTAMQGDKDQKNQLMQQYLQAKEFLIEQIRQAEAALQLQNGKTQQKRDGLKATLSQRQQVEQRKTGAETEAQQKNKDILDMERECARLENKKSAAELEEKQIVDKLWDSYELTRTTAEAERVQIDSLTQANRDISSLKRKISALGTPNLGAIDEYDRVSERYDYLCGQRDDVLTSKKELEAIIRDITTQMTEIFVTEFAKMNEYFSQTFLEMFGGGKAALVLEDPQQPLTCGIEIRVQPPGKQLKTITLLSGGEKAFVAIALYFAILKVRPTPFCMLDEIDAALDDRNVERFANYLRNLCQKTQFIVITHRRGTMEQADILYGVTMQEQGVSKILHLNLNQMEQNLGIVE